MKNLELKPEQFLTAYSPPTQVAAIKAMITRHDERRAAKALLVKQRFTLPSRQSVPGAFGRNVIRMLAARKKASH